MDKTLIEKYKKELLEMRKKSRFNSDNFSYLPTVAKTVNASLQLGDNGGLQGVVTTVRELYPLPNARFTIFSGEIDNMNVIDEDFTDNSGKTKVFNLSTPNKSISLDETSNEIPYSLYNVKISADGYLDNIHLNIPIFSGVISQVKTNMLLKETAGINTNPQIFDELPNYNL